jgi:hypothetical protein
MTITAVANARAYDWSTWMMGIFRSVLSGGAVALTTLGGASYVGLSPKSMWTMVGLNFITMAGYRLGEFLTLHGAPDQLQAQLDTAAIAAKTAQAAAGQAVQAVETAKTIAPPND